MGLFSSKKIYVSSSVRNLAGELEDRTDYLKTVVVANVLVNQVSMGQVIKDSYLQGPGMKLRGFYRWASTGTNYDEIGLPTAEYIQGSLASGATMASAINAATGDTVTVVDTQRGPADFSFWAEQWMFEEHPGDLETAWTSDFDTGTGEVVVTLASGTVVRFVPDNYDSTAQYIYATYRPVGARNTLGEHRLYIYRIGSGNVELDATYVPTLSADQFYPFIPVRLENEFLSDTYHPEAYTLAKKAYRKAFGRKDYDKIIEKVSESESLADIDHAYLVFGPSINAQTQASKEYIWSFFNLIYDDAVAAGHATTIEGTAFQSWYDQALAVSGELDAYDAHVDDTISDYPTVSDLSQIPEDGLRIMAINTLPGRLDFEISWKSLSRFIGGTGLAKPEATVGEIWFGSPTITTIPQTVRGSDRSTEEIIMYRQVTADAWEALTFVGLTHKNTVYKKKFVEITLKDALEDPEDSGFIVPLHYQALKDMNLVDGTQFSMEACNIVFNSYVIKKTGLLGSIFFKFLLAVVITVIATIAFPGVGTTIAGSFAASIGVTGVAAIIINAAITVLAGMVLTAIITPVTQAVLGDKIGAIVGAIAGAVAASVAGNFVQTGAFTTGFSQLSTAQALMKLTSVAADAYQTYTGVLVQDTIVKIEDLQKEYAGKTKELQELYAQNIGYGNGFVDPMMFTGNANPVYETADTFLSRTLLTGSDIAELSMELLSNFTSITLDTSLPLR